MKKTIEDFYSYFHSLPGIKPTLTNKQLTETLFRFYCGETQSEEMFYQRGGCITRTVLEFLKWVDVETLYVCENRRTARTFAKQYEVRCDFWRQSFVGLHPRPAFVVFDSPLSCADNRSAATKARFYQLFHHFPYPALLLTHES